MKAVTLAVMLLAVNLCGQKEPKPVNPQAIAAQKLTKPIQCPCKCKEPNCTMDYEHRCKDKQSKDHAEALWPSDCMFSGCCCGCFPCHRFPPPPCPDMFRERPGEPDERCPNARARG